MKTLTLRAFRDKIAAQTEPVVVVRREPDGSVKVLGTWTPDAQVAVANGGYYSFGKAKSGFGESRPAPKPGK